MTKYANADATEMVAMMTDYAQYLAKYAEAMKKMNEMNEDELSPAVQLYYVEVTTRINKKLMEAAVTQ